MDSAGSKHGNVNVELVDNKKDFMVCVCFQKSKAKPLISLISNIFE